MFTCHEKGNMPSKIMFVTYQHVKLITFRYDHLYKLKLTFISGKTGLSREEEIERPVNNFFDEEGVLIFKLFEPEVRTLQGRIAAASKKE